MGWTRQHTPKGVSKDSAARGLTCRSIGLPYSLKAAAAAARSPCRNATFIRLKKARFTVGCSREGRIMWTFFRKFGWLAGISLSALVSPTHAADAGPAVRGVTDFHHTEWNGLGAVFDIKQSSEGYLWLTTSKGVLRFDGVRFQYLDEVTRGAVHGSEIDSVFLSLPEAFG